MEIRKEMEDLSKKVAEAGFMRAADTIPYFTNLLFKWTEDNGYREALTEFVACFVSGALNESLAFLTKMMKDVAAEADAEKSKEGNGDE